MIVIKDTIVSLDLIERFFVCDLDVCDGTYRRPFNLKPGQAQFSEIGLAERWNLGRKKMHNILSKMEDAGLVEIFNSRIGSAITFSCVTGWETPDKPDVDSETNDR